jgi:arginine deiminase
MGRTKRFYEIPIPSERLFMHLDTVFTIVDRGVVVWYPGVMENIRSIHHYKPAGDGEVVRARESRNLRQILSDEFGRELTVIRTGGGKGHFADREQRTDGTNVLAIRPGVACTYERNVKTIQAMEAAGVTCIEVEGSELVRGLGGPRCMTMPLRRETEGEG